MRVYSAKKNEHVDDEAEVVTDLILISKADLAGGHRGIF